VIDVFSVDVVKDEVLETYNEFESPESRSTIWATIFVTLHHLKAHLVC
jgi:hypothetical protein